VSDAPTARSCGKCSLCCTVLRVDELRKPAGRACPQLRGDGGCGIYTRRPDICRAYRCLWLQGRFDEADRPDRIGGIVDLLSDARGPRLSIQETEPGAFDASPRLQAIAAESRESMPVRVVLAGRVDDPDRPFRVLLPGGEEQRVEGERVEVFRNGVRTETRRMPWLDRWGRRLAIHLRRRRLQAWERPVD